MKALRIWMAAVGVFYLLNLLVLWPSIWAPQVAGMYPGVELYQGEPIFQLLLDAWLIVGLGLAAIGVVLIMGSFQPSRYAPALVPVVFITEFVFGLWDIYSGMNYEEPIIVIITLVIHVLIIGSGLWAWKKSSTERVAS